MKCRALHLVGTKWSACRFSATHLVTVFSPWRGHLVAQTFCEIHYAWCSKYHLIEVKEL